VHDLRIGPTLEMHVCRAKGRGFLRRDDNKIHALNEADSHVIEHLGDRVLVKASRNSRDANGVPVLEQTELLIGIGSKRSHCSNNSARVERYQ